jgi:hypothetical protein
MHNKSLTLARGISDPAILFGEETGNKPWI